MPFQAAARSGVAPDPGSPAPLPCSAAGRWWCSVCPFMVTGMAVQKFRETKLGEKLQKWPKEQGEKYGPWFLLVLFGGILVWEDVWNLKDTAYLSGWLLLLITAGAVAMSGFERRYWCRYWCPIGGMNGMFSQLSATELRSQKGVCSALCDTYYCVKGGPAKGAGMATVGCPMNT